MLCAAGEEASTPQPVLMDVAPREESATTAKDDSTSVSGSEASQVLADFGVYKGQGL